MYFYRFPGISFLLLLLILLMNQPSQAAQFIQAKPVWPQGHEREKNLFVGFRAAFKAPPGEKVILRLAGSSLYRVFINSEFCGHGPARGPHGYFRVDELDLTDKLHSGKNLLAIEIAGYNINSYYLLDQPSFLQAEILAGCRVLAATGEPEFEACILDYRIRKVQRYSVQRTFIEAYRLKPGFDTWRKKHGAPLDKTACAILPDKKLLPRRVPYPLYALRQPVWNVSCGRVQTGVKAGKLWRDRSLTSIGPGLGGFPENELEVIPTIQLQRIATSSLQEIGRTFSSSRDRLHLAGNSYHILDFGTNLTGFIGARLTVHKKARLFITFDEILTRGDVDFKRLNCANVISYEMPPGLYEIESFEPYTLKFIKFILLEGECEIESIHLRELANPQARRAHFASSDRRLNSLYEAGRETFRQNALDIFMDCPSRERAGWLCDSYFSARAAFDLCGNTDIERTFFENFLLPERFEHLPAGMLPMCYPADHYSGTFIPNWALWFVIQLEEYLARSGDRATVQAARPKVLSLFDYFEKFKNSDGLLEKLESWVFIEWSEANKFVQDLNYPTSMLFAAALEAAGRMYDLPELSSEGEKVRKATAVKSFDSEFFVDNALRKWGRLKRTRNRSEVCQYFAFFFNAADPDSHPALWDKLCKEFGPKRGRTGVFPEVHEAAPFIGKMLRLEVLSRNGLCRQLLEEAIQYYLPMAERTGTLWEFDGASSSCNHGFASHIVRVLNRDALGIYRVDPVGKKIALRFSDLDLDWCTGGLPSPEGEIFLEWWKEGQNICYRAHAPAGYSITVENNSGRKLVIRP